MNKLSTYIQRFKESDANGDFTWASAIFTEMILLIQNKQPLQALGDTKSARQRPLSFFLIDELASGQANHHIHSMIGMIHLLEVNPEQENCFHHLLSFNSKSTIYVERTMNILMESKVKLDIKPLLLQQATLSFGIKLTVLEYAVSMRCGSSLSPFLAALMKSGYRNEIGQVLNTVVRDDKQVGTILAEKAINPTMLAKCGYIKN